MQAENLDDQFTDGSASLATRRRLIVVITTQPLNYAFCNAELIKLRLHLQYQRFQLGNAGAYPYRIRWSGHGYHS